MISLLLICSTYAQGSPQLPIDCESVEVHQSPSEVIYDQGRSVDVFISRLRKYLKSDPDIKIINLHGIGFRFNAPIEKR
jgi:hypothetical protein